MCEKRVMYDKVAITTKALSIFIVLGLFMTALVIGYGAFLGNTGGTVAPVSAKEDKKNEEEIEVVRKKERAPKENLETELLYENIE